MKRLHFIEGVLVVSVLILATSYWWRTRSDESPIATVNQVHEVPKLETDLSSPLLETNDEGWFNDGFWSKYIVAGRPQLKHKVIHLRSLGFPEHCINGLIKAEIDLRYAGVVAELRSKLRLSLMTGSDISLTSDIESLFRKKNTDYKAATGASRKKEIEIAALNAEIYSAFIDIDPERAQRLGDVLGKYNSLLDAGIVDHLEFTRLLAERDKELANILTPEEKRQFDIAKSSTGAHMRLWTKYMNLSEPQFDAVFDIQKSFDDEISSWQLEVAQSADRLPDDYSERLRQRDEQLKAALGEDGYSEFKMVSDPYFQVLDRWVAGQQLPSDVVDATYHLREEVGAAYREHLIEGSLEGAARTDYQNRLVEYSRDALQRIMGEGNAGYDIGSPPFNWIIGITNNMVPTPRR